MINVKLADANDLSLWDNYVRNQENATPFHLAAWNSAIRIAYGHQSYYLIAEHKNTIRGVLPLCLIKPPILAGTLCSLPFCDLGGIMADDKESRSCLLQNALKLSRSLGNINLTIRERASFDTEELQTTNNLTGRKVSMLLDLPESSDILLTNFKSKLRSQIKKADKNGLTFKSGREEKHIREFYSVFTRNMKQLGSPTHAYEWFNQIRKMYGSDTITGLVYKDDKVIAGGIILTLNNRAFIPWASTLSEYNRLAPNMLLYWNLLKYACDNGCVQFDFGRSTFGEGTYRFKKQWGAKPMPLIWQTYTPTGELIMEKGESHNRIKPIAEYLWSRLPLTLVNSIGPITRKYISL